MSVIFQHKTKDCEYAVHQAGASLRLYSNGIFHSQYHPAKILTGSVWDLMLLPAFFREPQEIKNVLILGLGGGVLVHQLKFFFPEVKITAVEIDKTHLRIAKQYFNVDYPGVELVHADAIEWLKAYRGPQFDLVIDDLFSADAEGLASRVLPVDRNWWHQLQSRVNEQGSLVINFACQQELSQSCFYQNEIFSEFLKGRFLLQTPNCENHVACLSESPIDVFSFRQRLSQYPLLDGTRKSCQLKYTVRPLPYR